MTFNDFLCMFISSLMFWILWMWYIRILKRRLIGWITGFFSASPGILAFPAVLSFFCGLFEGSLSDTDLLTLVSIELTIVFLRVLIWILCYFSYSWKILERRSGGLSFFCPLMTLKSYWVYWIWMIVVFCRLIWI